MEDSEGAPLQPTEALVEGGKVQLDRVVREALTKNLDVRIAALKADEAETQIRVQKATFDPRLELVGAGFPEASWEKQYNVVASKRFFTGTDIRAEGGTLFLNSVDRAEGSAVQEKQGTMRIRQSLLRGGNWGVNLGGIRSARIQAQNADATTEAQILEMLKSAESTYWAASYASHLWRAQKAGHERAERVLRLVQIRREAGDATTLDILEAEAVVASARDEVLRARKQFLDNVATLWQIVGLPVEEPDENLEFAPLATAEAYTMNPDPEESYALAMARSPVPILLANEVALKDIALKQARNAALPQVDVDVNVGTGDFFQHFTKTGETSAWNIMLRVGLPWTFRAERAELQAAKLRLENSEVARTQGLRQLKIQIHETCRDIVTGFQQVEAAAQAADLNRRKWEERFKRYEEGVTSVRELMESEGEYRKAEVREQEARLRLILAGILLARLEGSLPDRHRMSL